MPLPTVYCLMITGKDEKRLQFARLIGIKNFDMQTYKNKRMIIINHGKNKILEQPRDDIFELMVDKKNMTLGDLRNIALELVPLNACQVCWDDDDWKQKEYLQYMVDALLRTKSIAVFMKNRLEYNLANDFVFKSSFSYGNTHILSIKLDRLRYKPVDTLEDVHLQKDIQSFKKKYVALDNDPRLYIRVIHENNTSPYAVDTRTKIIKYSAESYYKEYDVNAAEKEYALDAVRKYYGFLRYSSTEHT